REHDGACFSVIKTLAGCLALQLLVLEQIRELADLVRIDPLTKTFNRRHFDETMRGIWQCWVDERIPFALVAVDIDHFKAINDTYGHHTGDAVLKAVAQRLNTSIGKDDAVVRMGGEEFALILARREADDAKAIANAAHDALRSTPFQIADMSLTVTASFGVAVAADGDDCPMAVYRRADRALYAAKSSGRDRVRFGALPSE
ncbi:MAG: GGDEF domain-containing protein, partial [Pseudomonadota bacterium]